MKTIFRIAQTELRLFFYSPIAWLILIIFPDFVTIKLSIL